jgi:AcrR family transcriptional regulator
MADNPKPLRADAARNRARVLQVAYDTFAEEGFAVPMDEIARRAGVGAGTIYRHFPTKEALYLAIVADRLGQLVEHARDLMAQGDPGEALFGFLTALVEEGARDQGLVEALAGQGFDIAEAEEAFLAVLADLLAQAQQAGAVRPDVDVQGVKTLLVGCQAMQRYSGDAEQTARVLAIVRDGLVTRRG